MISDDDNDATIDTIGDLVRLIGKREFIPVISQAFRIDQIFREDEELSRMMAEVAQFYDEFRTFDQQLTKKWAATIKYPMSDDHNLARVAQYLQVEKGNSYSRENFRQFLNERLLNLSESNENYQNDEEYRNIVSGYKKPSKGQIPLFSDVATELKYPRFRDGREDPLRLLAQLPVKIYITTSYSNFLERALEKERKTPLTQLCFCKIDKNSMKKEHLPNRDYQPTEKEPVVVHLFGLEDYTKTLVLSEDDYISFLMNAVEYMKSDDMFPSYLRGALSDPESSLLLLGYHLRGWDFRTLFRFIALVRNLNDTDSPSFTVQFPPRLGKKENEARSIQYLKNYFNKGKFTIEWDSTDDFIDKLWKAWNA